MNIVCISGKARHGKDTTALFLKKYLEENGKRVLITHYGDAVKYVATTFFGWNGEKDDAGRTLLQRIGTDEVRKHSPNFWVQFLKTILKVFSSEWDYAIIPDCRFPNEVRAMMESGLWTETIRVTRPNFDNGLTDEQKKHYSETALDGSPFDYYIINDGTLEDLERMTRQVGDLLMEGDR